MVVSNPSPMPEDMRDEPAQGLRRRTLVTLGAWSVPAIGLAIAAPAAAASDATAWDVAYEASSGDSVNWTSEDGQTYNEYGLVIGSRLTSVGAAAVPAGTTLLMTWDTRVFPTLTFEQVELNGVAAPAGTATISAQTTTGHTATVTAIIQIPIPAASIIDLQTTGYGFDSPDYHNPAVTYPDLVEFTMVVPTRNGESDTSNNSFAAGVGYKRSLRDNRLENTRI